MKSRTLQSMLAAFAAMFLYVGAFAAPGMINYQGQLTDPLGEPITTPVQVVFTFHEDPLGGTPLDGFSDTHTVTPDANGIYSTIVGSDANPIPVNVFDGNEVWLNVAVEGEDLEPRMRITSTGYAIRAASADTATTADTADFADDAGTLQGLEASDFLNMEGDAYVVVQTTDSPTQNGASLLAAYDAAKALTPNGATRSATNRAVVMVAPGRYDLGSGSLTLDANFVDLVGLSTARDNLYILSSENVVVQTASNVRIENLVLHYTGSGLTTHAYYPDTSWNGGTNTGSSPETRIRNTLFRGSPRSMRTGTTVEYAGHYEDCVAEGTHTFGGNFGTASGTFINCSGGTFAFAGYQGNASGTFINCTGGIQSFGGDGSATGGRFFNCVGGSGAFTKTGSPTPLHFACIQDGVPYPDND